MHWVPSKNREGAVQRIGQVPLTDISCKTTIIVVVVLRAEGRVS